MVELIKGEKVELKITEEQIKSRIKELAAKISEDFGDKEITLLCALKGSIFFLTDLARELGVNVRFDFLRASSYGNRTSSSGEVKLEHFEDSNFEGKNILIVEDIIDSGNTLSQVHKYISSKSPASIKLCSLLDKPSRREVHDITIDYLGFSVPDEFLVGYGLDYSERYRNLPYIGVLHFVD